MDVIEPTDAVFGENYSFWKFSRDVGAGIAFQAQFRFWREYFTTIAVSLLYLFTGYKTVRLFKDPGSDKTRAWIPSCLSSGLLFCACTPFSISWVADLIAHGPEEAAKRLISMNSYSGHLMVFFLTFLWTDLFCSIRFPGHMECFAGYIHHLVYICLVSNSLYWGWTSGLCVMFVEELPTLILGLGMAYPAQFKSELGFGITFVCLRIIFHTAVSVLAVLYTRKQSFLWLSGFVSLAVHLWWFAGWIKRQRRLTKSRKEMYSLPPEDPTRHRLSRKLEYASSYRLDSVLVDDPLSSASSTVGEETSPTDRSDDNKEGQRLLSKPRRTATSSP